MPKKGKVNYTKLSVSTTPPSRFPVSVSHFHNDINQPASSSLRKKFVQVNNNNIRIDFEGGGFMVMGNVGKDASGKDLFGMLINDGTTDRFFAGVTKG